MAATELISVGSGATSSSEFAIATGEAATICLKGSDYSARADIELKADASVGFVPIGLLSPLTPALTISAPGTYRVSRRAGGVCGVFRG